MKNGLNEHQQVQVVWHDWDVPESEVMLYALVLTEMRSEWKTQWWLEKNEGPDAASATMKYAKARPGWTRWNEQKNAMEFSLVKTKEENIYGTEHMHQPSLSRTNDVNGNAARLFTPS